MKLSTAGLYVSRQTRQREEGVRQRVGKRGEASANYHLFRLICRSVLLPRLILLERATEKRGDRCDRLGSKNQTKSVHRNKMSLYRSQISLRQFSEGACNDLKI